MVDELRRRREALRGRVPPPPPEPPPGEPEDAKARWALRRFLASIPIGRDLGAEELRQAEALAVAWVRAVRARDKQARRRERRLAAGREWPED